MNPGALITRWFAIVLALGFAFAGPHPVQDVAARPVLEFRCADAFAHKFTLAAPERPPGLPALAGAERERPVWLELSPVDASPAHAPRSFVPTPARLAAADEAAPPSLVGIVELRI